ncbi:hypothetical protein COU76_00320 [Candidatus Peregrinibacteria bacterium CG10_big_fil_rev_8_21_14_0_10_49_10]|nr:MAG: hypothetical protein COU76_00310 [Candidatus Peregrinibacteria bacterium CG10_big_fil_rev_8_21_14_0_10_49_10]PIR53586.1 MAG: hypothetical protein COU76_00320 [Candidatus Peregrinibacteria bacterium CG10_big_fil_rev_8_21_14_0_10_49_10]
MSRKLVQQLAISVPVFLLKEKKSFIAYTPTLDLSVSGSTQERAKKNFQKTLQLFLEELLEENTLETYLKDMGWTKKQKQQWQSPVEVRRVVIVPCRLPASV